MGGVGNIAGDEANANNRYATVGGGTENTASGLVSTVGGGESNTALNWATVGGGLSNTAGGQYSTVPGGAVNTAQGIYSFAAGKRAQAMHSGSFVWSDSSVLIPDFFSSTANNQFLISATGGVGIGTNAPAATLHVAGTSSAIITPILIVESSGSQMPLAFKNGATEHARIRADNLGNLIFATLFGTGKDIYFRAGDDTNTDMFIESSNGNVGIGSTAPGTARLKVQGGDVYIASPNSLVITSGNGSCWQIRVSDEGVLSAASVTCP